jgi:hypothetical protein
MQFFPVSLQVALLLCWQKSYMLIFMQMSVKLPLKVVFNESVDALIRNWCFNKQKLVNQVNIACCSFLVESDELLLG